MSTNNNQSRGGQVRRQQEMYTEAFRIDYENGFERATISYPLGDIHKGFDQALKRTRLQSKFPVAISRYSKSRVMLPLTGTEAQALLRALATANASEGTNSPDRQANTWVARRLLEIIGGEKEVARG
jgi:hypothetical protein